MTTQGTARWARPRAYIDGVYVKVKDRTTAVLLDAERRGALKYQDQSYIRPGYDRRVYENGRYVGLEPL